MKTKAMHTVHGPTKSLHYVLSIVLLQSSVETLKSGEKVEEPHHKRQLGLGSTARRKATSRPRIYPVCAKPPKAGHSVRAAGTALPYTRKWHFGWAHFLGSWERNYCTWKADLPTLALFALFLKRERDRRKKFVSSGRGEKHHKFLICYWQGVGQGLRKGK